MNNKKFEEVVLDDTLNQIKKVLSVKSKEYDFGSDRLYSFKEEIEGYES